jgi:outer membrane immunogenic protein
MSSLSRILILAVMSVVALAPAADAKPKKNLRAMAQEPAATTDWSGFYIGVTAGGIQGGDLDHRPDGLLLDPTKYPPSGPPQLYGSIGTGRSWIAGVHTGYLIQNDRLVYGYEVDFSKTGIARNYDDTRQLTPSLVGYFRKSLDYKVDWLATARARVGLAFDRALIYATGGAAFASISANSFASFSNGNDVYLTSADSRRFGWTAGGGIDYALTRNFSVRAEYLYADLGSDTIQSMAPPGTNGGTAGYYYTATSHNQFHIVRMGLNLRF